MANIKDIAKLAGVSKSTVSRVVSNNGFVKEETRDKIMKVMKELNYRPNMFAKGMRTNRSYSIGILFPDLSNPFFTEWFQIVDKISREKGYLNYICITDPKGESEEKRVEDLLARSIDGIILFSYRKDADFIEKLKSINRQTPIVCCDSMFLNSGLTCVCANGEKGTLEATSQLIDAGKKRIAYVKGNADSAVVNKRFEGYKKAISNSGLQFDESIIVNGSFSRECGFKAAKQLMELEDKPDAIMAATDYMAMGVLDFLNQHNYNIPQDVAVFGYDNLAESEKTSPALSTIALPLQQIAETSIHILIQSIENGFKEPVEHIYDCNLVNRDTN